MKLRKGMRVTCEIDGARIIDAKIQEQDGDFYICQNKKDGYSCKDKLGYDYSLTVKSTYVTKLRVLSTDIEDVYEGAIIVNKNGKRKVLGICGEVVFISLMNDYKEYSCSYTIDELKEFGYTIVPETPIEKEKMITIEGKEYSEGTIKAALREHVG